MNPAIIIRLQKMHACEEAIAWLETQPDMQVAWEECKRPDWMLWLAERSNGPGSTLRHLAVDFCEPVRHMMTDARSIEALEVARRHADGLASNKELSEAWAAAGAAAGAAAEAAAGAAAWEAAWAAEVAARVASRAAAWEASEEAWKAALEASRAAQADMIRMRIPECPWSPK